MTATMPQASDLRDCHLYRFWVRHPVTGKRVLGYIGETVRQPLERLIEHLYAQPWADTIIAWEVDEAVYAGKAAVLAAEKFAVETEMPLYNYEYNLNNPRRIKIWRAKEQRWDRDAAAGRPRWAPPVKQSRGPATSLRPERRVVPARKWPAWQKRLVGWSSAWTVLTITAFILLAHFEAFATIGDDFIAALVSASGLIVWVMCGAPIPGGKWERRARRVRSWWW